MLFTLALIVLCSSIIVFFAAEFGNLFTKVFSIPGVKLILPLVLASWLLEIYEGWGLWVLVWCQAMLHRMIHHLTTLIPFQTGAIFFTRMVCLFLLASLPVWIFLLRAKQKGRHYPQPFTYWLGLVLWIFGVFLLSIPL